MWMNQPSSHQEDLSAELVAQGADLRVVYASKLRKARKEIGWQVKPDAPWITFLRSRLSFWQALRITWRHRRRIHVVNGIWAEPAFFVVFAFCCLLGIPCCIYSEAPEAAFVSTRTARFKRLLQRVIVSLVARRVAGLLAISRLAEQAFASLGFPKSKIYRFGYFERIPKDEDESVFNSEFRDIVYVGRLVKGKGLELLINASATLLQSDPQLRLRIVGGGPIESDLRRMAGTSGIEQQVIFTGVVSSNAVPGLLRNALMLVLPSEADGWGIVVNQALQAGTPVVVSNCSGAAELIANGVNGYIFRTGDRSNLQDCMRAVIGDPKPEQMRASARNAGQAASAEHVAPYLLQCLEHMLGLRNDRPVPGWILNDKPTPQEFPVWHSAADVDFLKNQSSIQGAEIRLAKSNG